MRIIQTFCSFEKDIVRSKFGWYSAYYHLAAWSLSAHTLAKFYKDVTLYTDRQGYELLINQLHLPYSSVQITHDDLKYSNPSAWALAKLKTFLQQTAPFLHVDGDVFIWQKFDEKLLQSGVIAQNLEMASYKYERNLNRAKDHLRYLPLVMHPDISKGDVCSVNAGIIGGSDLEIFGELSRLAFAIANKNEIHKLSRNTLLNVNVLLEQVMLYRLLQQQGKKASCLFDNVFYDFGYTTNDVANFSEAPTGSGYIHLIGGHKRSKKTCIEMEKALEREFPQAHAKVSQLFHKKYDYAFDRMTVTPLPGEESMVAM
jgi:hypothetical protein